MRSEPLDRGDSSTFRFDLSDLVKKLLAECGSLTTSGSRWRKGLAFSAGRVFFHPDQRQMRMPLVLRMVRHVI
jgi:hypothetical protein